MAATIRRVDYFYATVQDRPGEAYRLLAQLAVEKVDLLAFNAYPMGADRTQLVLFPEDVQRLARAAEHTGTILNGPQHALLIQGDDELGALVEFHHRLFEAKINVYASAGLADRRGGFAYILYVPAGDFERAAQVLGA
jgi:hypothetical protein